MAKNFWFPSQAGSYSLPGGKSMRINIYQEDPATSNVDTNADLLNLPALKYDFGLPDNGTMRFDSWAIEFENVNNIFETQSIISQAKAKETFVTVYIDGAVFWRGFSVYENFKASEWYEDAGTLKYRKAKPYFVDRIKYFWLNDITLANVSYADEMLLKTLLENIVAKIGYNAGDLNFDSSLKITEKSGAVHNFDDFRIYDFGSNMLVRTFLIDFINVFGVNIYSLDDKYHIISKSGGSVKQINNSDILRLTKRNRTDSRDYVEVKCTRDYSPEVVDVSIYTHIYAIGSKNTESSKNWLLDTTGFFDRIYIRQTAPFQFGDGQTNYGSGNTVHLQDLTGPDIYTAGVETGMIINYNTDQGNQFAVASSIITDYDYDSIAPVADFYFIDTQSDSPDGSYRVTESQIHRSSDNALIDQGNSKVDLLCALSRDIYDMFLRFSDDGFRLSALGVYDKKNVGSVISFLGNNHKAIKAEVNLMRDKVDYELVRVG